MSVNFDQAAGYYDETQALPDDVAQHVMWAIVSITQATRGTRFVDLGVGTGRIALPLVEWGQRVVGLDLSHAMLLRAREKWPVDSSPATAAGAGGRLDLIRSDLSALPLAAGSTDAVLLVQVTQWIPAWRELLAAARRVLAPRGVLLHSRSHFGAPSPSARLVAFWSDRVAEHVGHRSAHPGARSDEEVTEALKGMGAEVRRVEAAAWTVPRTLAAMLDALATRRASLAWSVPSPVLAETVAETRAWAVAEYGDLQAVYAEPRRIIFDRAQWRDSSFA